MFNHQIAQLRRRQVLDELAIRFLEHKREQYRTLEQNAGRIWVQNFPEMWRLTFSQEEAADRDKELQQEKAEWLECMPATRWVSRLPRRVMEQFRVGRNEYDYGLMIEADAARRLGLKRTKHVEVVCGGDYLTTIWKKDYRGSFGWDSLDDLHAEIVRRGFRAVGETFSSIAASREQPDGSIVNYHLTRNKNIYNKIAISRVICYIRLNFCDIFVKMALDLRAALTCKLCLASNKVGLPALLL